VKRDKRPRPWPEKPGTPTKFRAGVAGPDCPCCGKITGHKGRTKKMKRLRARVERAAGKRILKADPENA
jgi:hypothetical protein